MIKKQLILSPCVAIMILLFIGCGKNKTGSSDSTNVTTKDSAAIPEAQMVAANLVRVDSLDLIAFNKQDTDLLYKFYNDSVVAVDPDGNSVVGSIAHMKELKDMFDQIPDIKIISHQAKFGSGDWTCVTGMLSGSSTKPTKGLDGKPIPATGKNFVIPFCMVANWKAGRIVEQRLYWDNQSMLKQMSTGMQ